MNLSTELNAVVTALRGLAGVDTASLETSEIVPPGVLVQLSDIDKSTLAGRELGLQLLLVVPDTTASAAAGALANLLAAVETWATADGPILARSVILPDNPTPLPGLVFPLTWRTDA